MSRRTRHAPAFSLFAFQDIITGVTGIVVLLMLLLTLSLVERVRHSPQIQTQMLDQEVAQALAATLEQIEELERSTKQVAATAEQAGEILPEEIAPEIELRGQNVNALEAESERAKRRLQRQQQDLAEKTQQAQGNDEKRRQLAALQQQVRELEQEIRQAGDKPRLVYNPDVGARSIAWIVDLRSDAIWVARVGRREPPRVFSEAGAETRKRAFLAWATRRSPRAESFVLLIRPSTIAVFQDVEEKLKAAGFSIGFDAVPKDRSVIDPETGAAW